VDCRSCRDWNRHSQFHSNCQRFVLSGFYASAFDIRSQVVALPIPMPLQIPLVAGGLALAVHGPQTSLLVRLLWTGV
jgi:hypothetical protein